MSCVRVVLRTRPSPRFAESQIDINPTDKTVNIRLKEHNQKEIVNNQVTEWSFKVDGSLHNTNQEMVYRETAREVVSRTLDGYNGTIMCYGQTGAGKSYTMTGSTENFSERGIIPRVLEQVFHDIEERVEQDITVRVSYLEIYNESLCDLCAMPACQAIDKQLSIMDERGMVSVKGLTCQLVSSQEEALTKLFEGEMNRAVACHTLNKKSSRSHCIFTLYIESRSKTITNSKYTMSKLNLVDLAGSERLGKATSEGQVEREATYINKSLSFLEQAVIALADRRREHVPFRQSKLTHVLKDAIGGNCNTVLIANIIGETEQIEETLSTLRFAARMACVPVNPVPIELHDPQRTVKDLEKEIRLLKNELAMHDILANRKKVSYEPLLEHQVAEIQSQVRRYLDGSLNEITLANVRQIQEVFAQFKVIFLQQEEEVEANLRQKFSLQERRKGPSLDVIQKAGSTENEVVLAGELERDGFGLGLAPTSSKLYLSPVVTAKKNRNKKTLKDSASKRERPGSPQLRESPFVGEGGQREHDVTSVASEVSEQLNRSNTPPMPAVAFEAFKAERGSEINRIFKENKLIYKEKQTKAIELAKHINTLKQEIDVAREALEAKTKKRQEQGEFMSSEGQMVIDEEEYCFLLRMRELQSQYRLHYEELRDIKAEVQWCQHQVNLCRQRLVSEFGTWYAEAYQVPSENAPANSITTASPVVAHPAVGKTQPLVEGEQEKLERIHVELMTENPDAMAFYEAKARIERKHNYTKAAAQNQTKNMKEDNIPTCAVGNRLPKQIIVPH
ncbi:kinesin-like protein KIF9 isoform X1 [Petromyzon marinus]|uniref:kinesin-like protein KIF9 isoform X1 n=1 Tax=Petromyzon marinus TaxID=7757 RepID=UPI003F6F44AF